MTSNNEVITEQPRNSISESIESPQLQSIRILENKSPKIERNQRLELLTNYDTLIVNQELNVVGSLCNCCDNLNKYTIRDNEGKRILTAIEEPNCCNISCCRTGRRFNMKVVDKNDDEVIHLRIPRECNCCRCCFCCRFQKLEIFSPPDNKIGSVQESWSCFRKQLEIYDTSNSDPIFSIDGPICEMSSCCCSDFTFNITNYETGEECGTISKKWSGLAKEALTYCDNFGINFPPNAQLNEKALLLGACILIDLMFFEKKPSEKDHEK